MRDEGLVDGCGLRPMAFGQPALPVGGGGLPRTPRLRVLVSPSHTLPVKVLQRSTLDSRLSTFRNARGGTRCRLRASPDGLRPAGASCRRGGRPPPPPLWGFSPPPAPTPL